MNLTSIHGRIPTGPRAPLATATSAIAAFSEALRLSMSRWGVDVVVVEAGSTTTGNIFSKFTNIKRFNKK